jgi:pullulanase/glycogen debranching enzyme
MKRFCISGFFLIPLLLTAQSFTPAGRLQGYKHSGDTTYFIFDEKTYGVQPQRVIIEGGMRDWNHNLEDPAWQLKKSAGGLWILPVYNRDMLEVAPGSAFKFRIDEGEWLNPPAGATNIRDGNLVFAAEVKPLLLDAEIAGKRDIRLIYKSARPEYHYNPDDYLLSDAAGKEIGIERILYIAPGELQLIPERDLDIRRLHYVKVKYLKLKVTVTYDGWFRHLYSGKELGANYHAAQNATWIRIFIPRADSAFVYLYTRPDSRGSTRNKMICDENGVWEVCLSGNWEGWYYDFTAHGSNEPGNHFYETNPAHFTDPWGRVSMDSFGPCRIWPEMKPAAPLKSGIPAMKDVIAYEVHVQDFTRNLPLPDSLKSTFKGMTVRGLKNSRGEKIGFDHLAELGINVLHLMPVQEYLHFPDPEWQAAFLHDEYMIEQGINTENYQWGYRTSHAFALESRYRVKGAPYGSQNRDFRDLVQAFHDQGIAVIVDVVFNHTAERIDNRQYYFNFSAMDVPYFYRTDRNLNYIGEYGTETKSEERPMMQRWIIEQCKDLIDQYGVDGFRIDIAGQTDEQTLKALRQAIGPDKVVYGEPWIASADPDYENNPDWDWYKADAPITFFQDDARNAMKGPVSNPQDKLTDRGYAGGDGNRERIKLALSDNFPEDKTPLSGINYLDIHDNWALADQFATTDWDGRQGVDEGAFKIAAALLFTSPGPIALHGGTEMMRSKGLAPLWEIVKRTRSGPIYLHGKRDTYNLARANEFIWENKGRNIGDQPEIKCNFKNMYEFWRGLLALRKSKYGDVFRIAEKPAAGYYQWIEPANPKLLGYVIGEKVFALLNTDLVPGVFEGVTLPAGKWKLIATTERIDHVKGINGLPDSKLKGGRTLRLDLQAQSLKIWVKE